MRIVLEWMRKHTALQELSCPTLALLDELLGTRDETVFNNLILRNLVTGMHLEDDARESSLGGQTMQEVKVPELLDPFDGFKFDSEGMFRLSVLCLCLLSDNRVGACDLA